MLPWPGWLNKQHAGLGQENFVYLTSTGVVGGIGVLSWQGLDPNILTLRQFFHVNVLLDYLKPYQLLNRLPK